MQPRRSSRVLDALILAGGLLAGLAAAFALRTAWAKAPGGWWVWIVFLAAAAAAGYGLRRMDRWLPEAAPLANPTKEQPSVRRWAGLLCLGASLGLTLWIVVRLWPDYTNWSGTAGPWLWALALFLAGGFLLGSPGRPAEPDSPVEEKPYSLKIPAWLEVLLFLGIAALAVYLRVHRLEDIPSGIYVDETNGALDALHILEGNGASPFATGWYGTPNGYLYYMAGMFKAFGATYMTLKAVSILPAVLTVLAIYPLGRLLFGSLGGLCAMFLMAVSRWHLSMSRWGWSELPPLLFQILATFFLLRGLRDKRASDFAIGGLLSGLMMYTYLSSRLALATLGVFAVAYLLLQAGGLRRAFRSHWQGLALFFLAFIVAFAPLAVTHITDPFTFNNRVQQISIFKDTEASGSLRPLLLNIRDHLRFFHQVGDLQGKHNLPGEPQVDPFTGVLFVIGLAYGLWRRRDWRYWLLGLWILFGLSGGVFSSNFESPQSYRTLTVVPAVALLAGDVLSRLGRGTAGLLGESGPVSVQRLARPAAGLILGALLAGSGVWETTIFFGKQADSMDYQAGFNLVENQAAHEAVAALDSGMQLYLSPRFYDFSPLRYLVYGVYREKWDQNTLDNRPYHLLRPEQDLPIASEGEDALVLLDLYYQPLIDTFLHDYPNAAVDVVKWRGEIPLYLRIQIPVQDLQALQGLQAVYTPASGSREIRRVYTIDETWQGRGYRSAEWSGQVRVPRSGEVDFTHHGDLEITLDGEPWSGPRTLCAGLHTLQVKTADARQGKTILGWRTPLGNEEIIPAQALFNLPEEEQGLTGYYYAGPNWEGDPVCRRNTPFLLLAWPDQDPVAGAFSASFKGSLRIENAGHYSLRLMADDGVRLTLDGRVLAEGLTPDQPNEIRAEVDLTSGDHPIQIDYFQTGGGSTLEFYWRKAGEGESPVPPRALVPETVRP